MRRGRQERIESAIDHIAAAALAASVGFALFAVLVTAYAPQQLAFLSAGAGALVYLSTVRFLRKVPAERRKFIVPRFEIPEIIIEELDELLLTEQVELILTDADRLRAPAGDPGELILTLADRLHAESAGDPGELILDDILAELGPNSRVVRLFEPFAMPTPGQLNVRIEQHLRESSSPAAPAPAAPTDASQALYQALADLRRSLR